MLTPLRVLLIDDSADDAFAVVRELQRGGFRVAFERVETAEAMVKALKTQCWDVIISDHTIPRFGGEAVLALYQRSEVDIPFILVSRSVGEEQAVEMLKAGAHDFILESNLGRLVPAVQRELRAAVEKRIRKETEAATSFLAFIVQSCDDAIIGKTLDGTVVSWNTGAEKLYGYAAGEMIGQSVTRLFPRYRPEELSEIMDVIIKGEKITCLETIRMRKDGSPVQVSITVSPVRDAEGRIIGASTVARDITRRKEEETERLVLIQELTAALARQQP